MSLMVFDDSKIEKIKVRNQEKRDKKEKTITVNPPTKIEDIIEASKNAKGGSELIYQRVKERVPEDLWNHFQVILSRVRELEDKPRILWFQDTSRDPEVQFLKEKRERDIYLSTFRRLPDSKVSLIFMV